LPVIEEENSRQKKRSAQHPTLRLAALGWTAEGGCPHTVRGNIREEEFLPNTLIV
jgi:hypothetical protein